MTVRIAGLAVNSPWCKGWPEARDVLNGTSQPSIGKLPKFDATWLPATLRRRTTPTIRLALSVALAAATDSGVDPAALASVFACSGGDTETLDRICTALNAEGRPVSPAQFHNSVHNAPSGYWAIATGSREPSTSICAFDGSFAAGLLEAYAIVSAEKRATLLVAYDEPPPPAIWPFRPIPQPFAVGLVLSPDNGAGSGSVIDLHLDFALNPESVLADPTLEAIRAQNPAARALPLLWAVATRVDASVVLPYTANAHLCARHRAYAN